MDDCRQEKTKAFHSISEFPNFLCLPVHPANNVLPGQGFTQQFSPEFVILYEALIRIEITLSHTRQLKEQSHRQLCSCTETAPNIKTT